MNLNKKLFFGYIHTQAATSLHKFWVARNLIVWIITDFHNPLTKQRPSLWLELCKRAFLHDMSKYRWDEAHVFALRVKALKVTKYGTDAYQQLLKSIQPALELHYVRNRHHPEWHEQGFSGMNEADRIELVADWGAAIRRSDRGDLNLSISSSSERFGYGPADEAELREIARQMCLLS